jgi:hypothetical protein
MGRMQEIAADIEAGMTIDEIAERYCVGFDTAKLYAYKVKTGVISSKPAVRALRPPGRRQLALAMYAKGSDASAVVAALGLKRTTASAYLWEARQIAAKIKADPLLD